jgi:hypothetical protein
MSQSLRTLNEVKTSMPIGEIGLRSQATFNKNRILAQSDEQPLEVSVVAAPTILRSSDLALFQQQYLWF